MPLLSTIYRRFSFLGTILAAPVDVSTTKLIFASYFSWPISLKKLEKPSDKVQTVHFLLCDDIVHFATYLVK
jgi:hypothetical protein